MSSFLIRRLLTLPLLLVGISLISFLLLNFAPGDAAEITLRRQNGGITPAPEAVTALREELGLDNPLPVRYVRWLLDATRGNLGESYRSGASIAGELARRLPATLLLASVSLALAVLAGLPLGVLAAMKPGSVVIDLAADQGGNVELSRPDEQVSYNGVTILGPANLPSSLPVHATQMYAKNLMTLLDVILQDGELRLDLEDEIVDASLVVHAGEVRNERVREAIAAERAA